MFNIIIMYYLSTKLQNLISHLIEKKLGNISDSQAYLSLLKTLTTVQPTLVRTTELAKTEWTVLPASVLKDLQATCAKLVSICNNNFVLSTMNSYPHFTIFYRSCDVTVVMVTAYACLSLNFASNSCFTE